MKSVHQASKLHQSVQKNTFNSLISSKIFVSPELAKDTSIFASSVQFAYSRFEIRICLVLSKKANFSKSFSKNSDSKQVSKNNRKREKILQHHDKITNR
jgi:hypothetical protein